MLRNLKDKLFKYYEANEVKVDIIFFIAGFLLDIIMISDIDDVFSILQQIVYLSIVFFILYYEMLFQLLKWTPGPKMSRYWEYRTLLLHFILGSLLNLYSLFYIKSASILSSIIFLLLLLVIICANELPGVKKSNISVKVGMFGICIFSFFSILFPVILGFVGWTPLILSIAFTIGVFYLMYRLLFNVTSDHVVLIRAVLAPSVSVILLFVVFTFMGWIPPVPLSVVEQGIYHNVEKDQGNYLLATEKDWWKFWHSGDQYFQARPGDKIYYYAQIFSPTRFADEIYVQWSMKSPRGQWQPADKIPLKIVGGRKMGFRGFTYKTNYQPGEYRVQVLTSLGQEISRIDLEVVASLATEPRQFQIITR